MTLVEPLPEVGSLMRLRHAAIMGTGWVIVALGVIGLPFPGPFGVPLLILGGMILMRNSASARRRYVRFKRRAPRPVAGIIAKLDRWRDSRRAKRRA